MNKNFLPIGALMLFVSGLALAQSPPPQPAVMEVIIVDVGDNVAMGVPKLVDIMKRGSAIAQKAGTHGKARLWALTWAGSESGRFAITIETPNLSVLAADGPKMQASPEWQKMLADFSAAGFKVVSESLTTEVSY
jgi:hypothetical protein